MGFYVSDVITKGNDQMICCFLFGIIIEVYIVYRVSRNLTKRSQVVLSTGAVVIERSCSSGGVLSHSERENVNIFM